MIDPKHDKVLHARVSAEIFDKLSAKAKKHRVTVSNLLRNLMEDYLEIHADVWEALDHRLRDHLHTPPDSVIGYQPLTLAKETICSHCQRTLKRSASAYLGFSEHSSKPLVICPDCYQTATTPSPH